MIPRLVCGLKVLSKLFLVSDAAEYVGRAAEADLVLTEQGNSDTVPLFSYGLRAKYSPSG